MFFFLLYEFCLSIFDLFMYEVLVELVLVFFSFLKFDGNFEFWVDFFNFEFFVLVFFMLFFFINGKILYINKINIISDKIWFLMFMKLYVCKSNLKKVLNFDWNLKKLDFNLFGY